jgi:tetratricopeptide (TPR) repeat protein
VTEEQKTSGDYEKGQEFLKSGDLSQAANACHNALLDYEQHNDEGGVANASDKLGDICLQREDYATALKHFQRAYSICEKAKDLFSLISLKKKMVGIYRQQENFEAAIATTLDLLDIFRSFKNPKRSVEVLESLADLYLAKGDRAKAADAYRTAAAIHDNFKHPRLAEQLREKATAAEKGKKPATR